MLEVTYEYLADIFILSVFVFWDKEIEKDCEMGQVSTLWEVGLQVIFEEKEILPFHIYILETVLINQTFFE